MAHHVLEQAEDDVVVEDSSLVEEQVDQLSNPLEEQSLNSNQDEEQLQPSFHQEEEVDSFGGEWRDSWSLERGRKQRGGGTEPTGS